jgi:hypothetical protein
VGGDASGLDNDYFDFVTGHEMLQNYALDDYVNIVADHEVALNETWDNFSTIKEGKWSAIVEYLWWIMPGVLLLFAVSTSSKRHPMAPRISINAYALLHLTTFSFLIPIQVGAGFLAWTARYLIRIGRLLFGAIHEAFLDYRVVSFLKASSNYIASDHKAGSNIITLTREHDHWLALERDVNSCLRTHHMRMIVMGGAIGES